MSSRSRAHDYYKHERAAPFPVNTERNLPVTVGLMLVNDAETGLPHWH